MSQISLFFFRFGFVIKIAGVCVVGHRPVDLLSYKPDLFVLFRNAIHFYIYFSLMRNKVIELKKRQFIDLYSEIILYRSLIVDFCVQRFLTLCCCFFFFVFFSIKYKYSKTGRSYNLSVRKLRFLLILKFFWSLFSRFLGH